MFRIKLMAEYLKTEEMSSYIKNIENEVIIFYISKAMCV